MNHVQQGDEQFNIGSFDSVDYDFFAPYLCALASNILDTFVNLDLRKIAQGTDFNPVAIAFG